VFHNRQRTICKSFGNRQDVMQKGLQSLHVIPTHEAIFFTAAPIKAVCYTFILTINASVQKVSLYFVYQKGKPFQLGGYGKEKNAARAAPVHLSSCIVSKQ